ncbi:LysM domain-containing protein [Conexibacter sp. JD483]|uniref:LysM peptidoglycan-binding domain-containing protein n=1 Tax=unclassified Conexibacter TaxID=2627773 RepID=UPI00271F6B91|nr:MULTISPECIES: LysM domain-containing protein [unclassified Conexibacter]MDO8187495.1 LysM domain-containing protein [Conexibacter sp. CPCC 205706]MDO8199262.1 LysM domain-containing protein [Conexibacter sp. CPCC 205762]MDR9369533.1 LysM domain-containing protein [Conexibacter sp. JD483]
MRHRNPVRFLAPLALVAVVVGVFAVVQAARRDSPNGGSPTATVKTTPHRRQARRRARARTYVVRSGDNLTIISERTGVPLETLQQLNPDVSAQSLSVGQKLRLTQ